MSTAATPETDLDLVRRLLAEAEANYAAGLFRPVEGQFYNRHDYAGECRCALGAAAPGVYSVWGVYEALDRLGVHGSQTRALVTLGFDAGFAGLAEVANADPAAQAAYRFGRRMLALYGPPRPKRVPA